MVDDLKDAISVIRFDKHKIAAVAGRNSATKWGVIFLAVPPVVNLFLSSLLYPSGFGSIFSRFVFWTMMIPSISLLAAIFGVSLCAEKSFKRGVSHTKVFRVMSYAAVFLWVSVLPFLFDVMGISLGYGLFNLLWMIGLALMLAVAYQFLVQEYKLNQQDAIICLVVGILAYFVVNYLLGRILVGGAYRIFY